jgi:hypothetical protein
MRDWFQNDSLFLRERRLGNLYADQVAERLRQAGLIVAIPPQGVRESIRDAPAYLDSKDLWCAGRWIEVKSRRVRFTSPEDFPFQTIMVDTVSGWNAKTDKPFVYACISRPTGAIIYTPGDNPSSWIREKKHDQMRGFEDEFYLAPRELWGTFDELVSILRGTPS